VKAITAQVQGKSDIRSEASSNRLRHGAWLGRPAEQPKLL